MTVRETHIFKWSAKPHTWVCTGVAPSPTFELQVNIHPSQLQYSQATEAQGQKPAWLCLTGFQSYTLTWASGSSALYPSWAHSLSGETALQIWASCHILYRGYIRIQSACNVSIWNEVFESQGIGLFSTKVEYSCCLWPSSCCCTSERFALLRTPD